MHLLLSKDFNHLLLNVLYGYWMPPLVFFSELGPFLCEISVGRRKNRRSQAEFSIADF